MVCFDHITHKHSFTAQSQNPLSLKHVLLACAGFNFVRNLFYAVNTGRFFGLFFTEFLPNIILLVFFLFVAKIDF